VSREFKQVYVCDWCGHEATTHEQHREHVKSCFAHDEGVSVDA